MYKFKKILISSLVFFVSSTVLAQNNLKIATDSGASGSPSGNAIENWAKMIEDGSNGELKTRLFYQNQLGGQQEVFDQHIAGDVQLMLNWPMTSYDKRIGVIYTPYMFTTWEDALAAYKPGGWLNEIMDAIYSENGLKFFGAWPEGFNGVATRGKYALTADDAQSIKVRVPPVFPFVETIQSLGYQTAQIDWGEVFTSIQTGVVDGDAANVIYYDYEYFRDTLDYYVRSKQQFITGVLSMNLKAWNKLTPELQETIQNAAVSVMEDQFKQAFIADNEIVQKWTNLGKQYIELDDDQLSRAINKVRNDVWPLMEKDLGAEIMQSVFQNSSKP